MRLRFLGSRACPPPTTSLAVDMLYNASAFGIESRWIKQKNSGNFCVQPLAPKLPVPFRPPGDAPNSRCGARCCIDGRGYAREHLVERPATTTGCAGETCRVVTPPSIQREE